MKDLSWKIYFTACVVTVALALEAPPVMWALCILVVTEIW